MSRPSSPGSKDARLAAALRDNLRRRKAPTPGPSPSTDALPSPKADEARADDPAGPVR